MPRPLVLAGWLALVSGCAPENTVSFQEETDTWAQAPNNQVDILWVIDNSYSMAEEQATLTSGFASFAGQLDTSGSDFHLGVITTSFDYTDPNRGALLGEPPFLTSEDADYPQTFAQGASTVGVEGSDKEKGFEAALYALHPSMVNGGPNDGFLRSEAQLLVIFVSDEDDCSDNGALEGQAPTTCYTESDELTPVSELVADFRDLKDGNVDLVQLGAIVGHTSSACPEVYPGARYLQGAALTGGVAGDICESDWSGMLEDLGIIASGIRTKFRLSRAAQPDTLVVHVDEQPVVQDPTDGWTYDQTTWFIEFHGAAVPPRGSSITATYTVDPTLMAPSTSTATAE
jgi:hypothetical protein